MAAPVYDLEKVQASCAFTYTGSNHLLLSWTISAPQSPRMQNCCLPVNKQVISTSFITRYHCSSSEEETECDEWACCLK